MNRLWLAGEEETRRLPVLIEGDTYAVRSELKKLGCRWNPALQSWTGPASAREALERLAQENLAIVVI